MARARLLIAYAHPDDESFGLGAVIARYVERGVEVGLICATNGDCGTVDPALLNGYQSVAELRLAELDRAAAVLGLHAVYKLGYKDSGMMGSATAQDPACLWQASQAEVVRRVTVILREFKPQVVITFNRYGGYGHPDHIAIQRATTEAFYRAGDPDYLIEGLPPYAPQKLYYSGIPASMLRWRILMARLQGRDPRRLGRNHDVDLVAILDHLEPIHARVDIRDYHRQWDAASACHASQLGSTRMPALPLWLRRRLFTHQGFTRIHPQPSADRVDERDLFDGVTFATPDAVRAS
jgi:mycothiol S-conjugate amidase